MAASTPIKYRHGKGGGIAFGVEVDLLPQILEVWLKARDAGALTTKPQMAVAERADILTRALAKVALVALVDEATGYQDVRARDALARILEAYIEKELQPWTKTFPENFYKEIFRLRGWNYKGLASGESQGALAPWAVIPTTWYMRDWRLASMRNYKKRTQSREGVEKPTTTVGLQQNTGIRNWRLTSRQLPLWRACQVVGKSLKIWWSEFIRNRALPSR